MNTKVSEYIVRSLWSSGCAVIDTEIAHQLTGDLIWASRWNAETDFMAARLSDRAEWTLVACRSDHDLAARIQHITGRTVTALRPYTPPRAQAPQPQPRAEDAPPAWPCAARTAWFEERGIADPSATSRGV